MMKKSNKKGFTLVELMVVGTIMVMSMGAILNWIQPMNRFYSKTLYNSDANDVGSILTDFLESEVRYSTNICIIEGYQGVPVITEGYLRDSSGNKSVNAKFTDVIIIDNNTLRGRIYGSYEADGTIAHRKGATGALLKAPVNSDGDGIDIDNLVVYRGEDIYSDMKAEFEAYLNIDDQKNKCLTIGSKFWRPEAGGNGYEYNKMVFNQTRDMELVNINLTNGKQKYKAEYYTNRIDSENFTKYLANSFTYDKFARATAPGGASEGINQMYSGMDDGLYADSARELTYTYIFYTKATLDNDKVTVTVKKENGAQLATWGPKDSGSIITAAEYDNFKNIARNNAPAPGDVGGKYVRYEFSHFDVDGEDFENIKDVAVTNDMELVAIYDEIEATRPAGYVRFYDRRDTIGNWIETGYQTSDPIFNSVPIYVPDCVEGDNKVSASEIRNPNDTEVYEFDSWNSSPDGSGVTLSVDDSFTGDAEFYAIYKNPAELEFQQEDGTVIDTIKVKHSTTGSEVRNSAAYSTQIGSVLVIPKPKLLSWEVYDAGGNPLGIELENMTDFPNDKYIVKVKLVDPPIVAQSVSAPAVGNWEQLKYTVELKNNSGHNINVFELYIPYPDNVTYVSSASTNDWRLSPTIDSTNSMIVITSTDNSYNYYTIADGATVSFELYVNSPTTTPHIEYGKDVSSFTLDQSAIGGQEK